VEDQNKSVFCNIPIKRKRKSKNKTKNKGCNFSDVFRFFSLANFKNLYLN
jgi:hypothetical protein